MGTLKIEKHIVKYRVGKPEEKTPEVKPVVEARPSAKVIRMTEEIQRPEMLIGSTYKIKTPVSDHAMYVTINDIVLNEGTEHEQRRPFAHHLGRVPQGRRRDLPGGRAQGRV
jgi:hypothetical protein